MNIGEANDVQQLLEFVVSLDSFELVGHESTDRNELQLLDAIERLANRSSAVLGAGMNGAKARQGAVDIGIGVFG